MRWHLTLVLLAAAQAHADDLVLDLTRRPLERRLVGGFIVTNVNAEPENLSAEAELKMLYGEPPPVPPIQLATIPFAARIPSTIRSFTGDVDVAYFGLRLDAGYVFLAHRHRTFLIGMQRKF